MDKNFPYDINHIRRSADSKTMDALKIGAKSDRTYAYAACVKASRDVLNLDPFNEQLYAAHYLYKKRVVEMATGEGKTLSAVFAAFLKYLDGGKTHILTFNDYLAHRDYNWMKPVYDALGMRIALIAAETPREERKPLYEADVLYSTVKEIGFDSLRDFLASDEKDTVIGADTLDFAVFDEADSVLIDEARVPMVVAASIPGQTDERLNAAMQFVKALSAKDYTVTKDKKGIYLTDSGGDAAESAFELDNLYSEENNALLALINDCLKAQFLLTENEDYIVKADGESRQILLIDEFTGRAAYGRHYPGMLHNAVELKHDAFNPDSLRFCVCGQIPVQFFARKYRSIAGMTGTVSPSDEEFELLYDLHTAVVRPHNPTMRIDLPPEIYFDKSIKLQTIVNEVLSANKRGQPVLIGVEDIAESDLLAAALKAAGLERVQILSAKNDEIEAEIIKNAGALGEVTVSANMAGRGVDIQLGGKDADKAQHDAVADAGGLYVISTSLRENSRINRQLQGRAGRQGDPGMSKTYAALDDAMMIKHELKKLVPKRHYPQPTAERLTDRVLLAEVSRVQRIAQGENYDARDRLLRFTAINEKHRDIFFETKSRMLRGETDLRYWQRCDPENYNAALERFGEEAVERIERESTAAAMCESWRDYLDYTSQLRNAVHLTSVGGKSPAEEFNIACEEYFDSTKNRVEDLSLMALDVLLECESAEDFTIRAPQDIRTYLLEENGDELVKRMFLQNLLDEHTDLDEEFEQSEQSDSAQETVEVTGGKPEKTPQKGFFSRFFGKNKNKQE
jgi:preprotein translocase subunit SecA